MSHRGDISILSSAQSSPVAKLTIAILVFCIIVGGWWGRNRYQQATVTLPDDEKGEGACDLWFVGSSSIHRWTSLDKDMAPWVAHNRGINSATFAQILPRFAHEKAGETPPRAIILYAGENDIASGIPVRTAVRNLGAFLDLRSRKFGDVPVLVLSAKPSPGRWMFFKDQQLLNAATRNLIPHARRTYYGDITTPLLKGGRMGDNYQADGVHMNAQGYRIWAEVVRARLKDILPPATIRACAPTG